MPPLFPDNLPPLDHLEIADTFWKRAIGLLGRSGLPKGTGLLLPHCRSIHTWFMRFPIDVIFLDADHRPVKIVRNLKPWRMAWGNRTTQSVLEVQSGWLPSLPGENPY